MVLHPGMLRFASAMHVLSRAAFALAIVSAPLFFILPWARPSAWLVMPGMVVFFGIPWAISASLVRCRVCTMKMLVHQPCPKHRQAPAWPMLGYHTTLAIRSLYSRQVRCPYCGTPNRLGGPPDHAHDTGQA